MKNYYEPLGLSPSATPEQIKAAYTNVVLRIQGQTNFASLFSEIHEAYDILSHPDTKKKFDKELLNFYTGKFNNHTELTAIKAPLPKEKSKQRVSLIRLIKVDKVLTNGREGFFKLVTWVKSINSGIKFLLLSLMAVLLVFFFIEYYHPESKGPIETSNQSDETPVKAAVTTASSSTETDLEKLVVPKDTTKYDFSDAPSSSPIVHYNIIHLKNYYSPFTECFGYAIRGGNATLTVLNHFETDAVICLYNTQTGATIRNNYVSAGSTIYLTDIPEGWYKIRALFGNDWSNDVESPCGSKGYFTRDVGTYEKDGSEFFTDNAKGHSIVEYTLLPTINGNSTKSPISTKKFFNQ